jgi:phenylpyruvate tautomerase PptA (4-oxalocrotonate tautomerase family)
VPNILIHLPSNAFADEARAALVRHINEAAARAEQIPEDPRKRALCWVLIHELESKAWTCGGADLTLQILPCMAQVYLPTGVLDDASRTLYVQLMHEAFKRAMPSDDKRQVVSSVVLHEIADGTWGVNGAIWTLPYFARAAGFMHLQHLVPI